MRRRDLLAGIAGTGVLAAGSAIAIGGVPELSSEGRGVDPVTLETIDAPGSSAGDVTIPAPDRPTFIDFFGTWCPPCSEQMPALVDVESRIGGELSFVSVTTENVGDGVPEEEVVDWWDDHDGDWTVGVDRDAELLSSSLELGLNFPIAVAIDADGRIQWSDSGVKSTDELLDGIETVLDAR